MFLDFVFDEASSMIIIYCFIAITGLQVKQFATFLPVPHLPLISPEKYWFIVNIDECYVTYGFVR